MFSQNIEKNTFIFEAKVWWTLPQNRYCPRTGDSILSLVWDALIAGLIARYEFDIGEVLA